jgi:hypothetical protein
VKILIQISCANHERLLRTLVGESALYYTLLNGVKIDCADGGGTTKFVEFICDADQARRLLETATQLCPEAAPQIKAGKMLPLRDQ